MDKEKVKNSIILTIAAISIFVIYQNSGKTEPPKRIWVVSAEQKQAEPVAEEVDYFKDLQVEAKSAYVFDTTTGEVVFEKNSTEQLPLASITKVMTAIVAEEVYSPENKNLPSEKFNSLMTAMLIESNNGAASTLAKSSETTGAINFIGLMNKKAGELGLEQTIFSNPSGLDVSSSTAGAYGSAEDVSNLILYGYQNYPEVFDQTKYPEVEAGEKMIINKNILTGKIDSIVAGKTGFTNLAGGNLALLVKENGKLFSIIVLGSSEAGRFEDAEKLINATAEYAQQ